MPWKNGLGVTQQIAISPAEATVASGFSYRLSTALVAQPGPFSRFIGYDRILVILDGAGIVLHQAPENRALRPLTPFVFSGDDDIAASPIEGGIVDFNVIYDRTQWRGECEILKVEQSVTLPAWSDAGEQFLFCVAGELSCPHSHLRPKDTLAWGLQEELTVHALKPDTIAIHVRLFARNSVE